MTETYLLQDIIGKAILELKSHIVLSKKTSQDDVRKAIRVFMRKHPEIFWFSHVYIYDKSTSTLYLSYNFNVSKKIFYVKEIDNAVRCLFQPFELKQLSDLEKVTYVYKWIAKNTTYNEYSSFNQTIYSVLINRNSVCTGYAKTAQYLLGLIGVESELVFGKFHADETTEGRHVWNVVKIDGLWYHVDFCLADPSLRNLLNQNEELLEFDGLLWNFFCKPTEYILKNRSIEYIESIPECENSIENRIEITLLKPSRQLAVCKSDSGTSAKIYLDSFNKNRVIKVSRTESSLTACEYDVLRRLSGCKHIIKSGGINETGLVLEYLTPWCELLNSHYYRPNEKELINILIQLTEGLIECRNRGIAYLDIHYNNVFVSKDGICKWGDFGNAYPVRAKGTVPSNMTGFDGIALGSRWFMAPETIKDNIFTEASAIYSLAMLAYFVMNGMRPPFLTDSTTEQEALNKRLSEAIIPLPIHSSTFGRLSGLICNILNSKLLHRPNKFESIKNLLINTYIDVHFKNTSIATGRPGFCIEDKDGLAQPMRECPPDTYCGIDSDKFAQTFGCALPRKVSSDGVTCDTDLFVKTHGRKPASGAPVGASPGRSKTKTQSNKSDTTQNSGFTYQPSSSDVENKKFIAEHNPKIASILGAISRWFNICNDQKNEQNINACIYAPEQITPFKTFLIRVYMYQPHEQHKVVSKIKEIDPTAVRKEYKPLDLPVKEGDKITVQLDYSDGVQCKDSVKTVIWRNHYTDCSFSLKLMDENNKNIDGAVYVLVNDIPAGEMLFTIEVVEANPRENYTKIDSRRFSKIFISYAHQDESQVRGIAEGCKMLGTDYFFDRHTLQAGDIFKEKILKYIDDADLFVLCWSKNAAESEWVKIEREYALRLIREEKSGLSIYPLSLRPEAPLPIDMSDKYNFGKL